MAIREDSLSRGAMFYLPPTPLIPLPQRRSCLPIRHHSLGRGIRFFEGDGESGALTVPLKKPYLASVFGASYGLPMLVERGQLLCPRSPHQGRTRSCHSACPPVPACPCALQGRQVQAGRKPGSWPRRGPGTLEIGSGGI